ncbi:hypothetical protein AMEX_G24343 [Astyanax mexicanus]|uniref:Transformer-2 protein homolog beta n=1 Tax=Astyanax mexicanus TaxID=7994 RepID=A0A8T2KSI5_ASTMX|nr:hypothetical protein AMEX_G24343 [Astyanax mexicanus]
MSDNEKEYVERESRSRSRSHRVSAKSNSESPRRSPAGSKDGSHRSRSRSHSRSRSRSRSRRSTRRRYSRSHSRSRSRSHSRRRHSRSRSYSHEHRRHRSHSHSPMSNRRRHVGNRANPDPNCCLGVFGLSLYTTERDLREVFSKYGPLSSVSIVYDQQSRRSRGFAFVYFENREDSREYHSFINCSNQAKERANGMELDGRRIRVDYSITQRPHTPTPGIYMGRPTYGGGRPSASGGRSRDYDRGYDRGYERYDDREYYKSYRSDEGKERHLPSQIGDQGQLCSLRALAADGQLHDRDSNAQVSITLLQPRRVQVTLSVAVVLPTSILKNRVEGWMDGWMDE